MRESAIKRRKFAHREDFDGIGKRLDMATNDEDEEHRLNVEDKGIMTKGGRYAWCRQAFSDTFTGFKVNKQGMRGSGQHARCKLLLHDECNICNMEVTLNKAGQGVNWKGALAHLASARHRIKTKRTWRGY